ncbi:MAG: insulinase family protein [Phycisphaerales bacterium]|nr:insulinase family protein [Phycisphaerales bacterium]
MSSLRAFIIRGVCTDPQRVRMRPLRVMMITMAMLGAACTASGATQGPDERAPAPSTAIEIQTARRSGVTSIWLAGGIRVHHRRIETVRNQVVVTLAMSGGELLETVETRGLSRLSAIAMTQWTSIAPSAAARAGAKADIRIVAGAPIDGLQLRVVCDPRTLRIGTDALREMVESPTLTRESVDKARDMLVTELRREEQDERSLMNRALSEAMSPLPPEDPRGRPLDPRQVMSITPEQVRAWITRHAAENGSTIEVAVVGDVALSDAIDAVDGALGTLPPRARPGPGADARIAPINRAPGPVGVTRSLAGWTSRAAVSSGFVAPEIDRLDDQRALRAAGRVIAERARLRLGNPGLVGGRGDPTVALTPVPVSGMGTFLITAQVAPADAAGALAILDAELDQLSRAAPTPAELVAAVVPLIQTAKELETDARYWSGVLARSTALRVDPDAIMSAADYYKALTPDAVRDTMRRYLKADSRIRLTILPPE